MGKKGKTEKDIARETRINEIIKKTFSETELAALEHKMNLLLSNRDIRALRFACYKEVQKKIVQRMQQRRERTIKALREAVDIRPGVPLSDADKEKIEKIIRDNIDLSQDDAERAAKEYIINAFSPTENALKNAFNSVTDVMLEKEITAFSRELDDKKILSKSGWCKFANAINYTGSETLDAIADALGMSKEEKAVLHSKNIPEYFKMNADVSSQTEKYIKRFIPEKITYTKINDFCEECGLSIDALKKFNLSILKRNKNDTSDEVKFFVLLKLIAAFRLEKNEAKSYLKKADRSFIMSMDLAFLTAITTGYRIKPKKPEYVALITHHLSRDIEYSTYYTDCPRFASPYRFTYLDEYALDAGLFDTPSESRS